MRLVGRAARVVLLLGVLRGPSASAQSPRAALAADSTMLLDVPYLPQSALLCGGAALAMVERWYGRRGVYAEDFAALVHPESGGIFTTDLAAAASARGWNTEAVRGTAELAQGALRAGTPVIALLRVAPDRYHYVVILGWSGGVVIFHDPAGMPSTRLDAAQFMARWQGADQWMMLVRPRENVAITAPPPASLPVDSLPCRPWLDRAVDAANAGQLAAADSLLDIAARACPDEPVVLRERAGVRFQAGDHAGSARLVAEYLTRAPEDERGWLLLATDRYLAGDPAGALVAWNRVGRPRIDLLRVDGPITFRFQAIADAASLPHGTLLTPAGLALAQRRLADLPALEFATVRYRPLADGLAEVHVAVAQRPMLDPAWRLAAGNVVRAAAQQELRLEVTSPTRIGEQWSALWRWNFARPRATLRIDIPTRLGVPGTLTLEGVRESFRFGFASAPDGTVEERHGVASIGFAGWISPAIRPSAALRFERWQGTDRYLTISLGTGIHSHDDHLTLDLNADLARSLGEQPSYTRQSARLGWSSPEASRTTLSARLGATLASRDAPLGSWAIAGGNAAWALPLRAHQLITDHRVRGERTGRQIVHAGLAADHPLHTFGAVVLGGGVFLDGARVMHAADGTADRNYLDGGIGMRIRSVAGDGNALRVDLARSLNGDGKLALTVSVIRGTGP